jgi:plasmid stability protein
MAGRSVTVELPDELYERLQRRAAEAQRSLSEEVARLLAAAVPAEDDRLPPELEQELARLETLDKAALRKAARPALSARRSRRCDERSVRPGAVAIT